MAGSSYRTHQGLPDLTGSAWQINQNHGHRGVGSLVCARQSHLASHLILTKTLGGRRHCPHLTKWASSYMHLVCSRSKGDPDHRGLPHPTFLPQLPGGLDPSSGSGAVPWGNHFPAPSSPSPGSSSWVPSSGQKENTGFTQVAQESKPAGHSPL